MSDIHNDPSTPNPGGNADGTQPPLAIPAAIPLAKLAYAPPARQLFFPAISMRRPDALLDVGIAVFAMASLPIIITETAAALGLHLSTPLGPLYVNVPLGISFLVFVAGMLILRRQSFQHVGLTIPSRRRFWILLPISLPSIYAAAIAGALVFMVFFVVFGGDEASMMEDKVALFDAIPRIPPWILIPFVMFVGVHEELLFRGFLLSRLRAATRSDFISVAGSAAVFGLMHMYQGPIGVVQTAAIGAALAIITIHAQTIWPAIIAHAFLDGVNMSLMPFLQEWFMKSMQEFSATQPAILGG